ncbi:hypothetical protein BY996DRAFT_8461136 [Phakopsora pachyrhizi]|nr:hypothetical protein BY996DRAFT_8461136 [Phakopsora pachyrhizi]
MIPSSETHKLLMSFQTNQIESDRFDGLEPGAISICGEFQSKVAECRGISGKLITIRSSRPVKATLDDIYLLAVPASECKFDLEEDEKRKQASKMEIRRSKVETWLQVPRQRSANLVIDLCQKILEETKGDRDEDLIFKLYLDSEIYHTYIHKKLTLAEVGSSSGRPRPACLPDPTKKRRISQTIDQKLKLPKNESSSSGLDNQQTENATEETALIPQIKKGVHKVLITSTPYTTYCALLLYIYSKVAIPKERKKEKKIKG